MSLPMRWLERLALRRMPDDERHRLVAFRTEIERNWRPRSWVELSLERRSQLVHLATCLTAGGFSLLSVGFAGLVTSAGTVVLAIAPAPARPETESGVPTWLGLLLAAGILSLSIESIRFPRSVRTRFGLLVGIPLAVGALGAALTMQVVLAWDVVLLVGLVVGGLGCLTATCGRFAGRIGVTRIGLAATGAAALGVSISDSRWTAIYIADGEQLHGVGCAMSAIGAMFMANGLLLSQLDPAVRA